VNATNPDVECTRTHANVSHDRPFTLGPGVPFKGAPYGVEAFAPANLFSFIVGAAVVRDAHFADATKKAGDFGSDFELEAEAPPLDADALNDHAMEPLAGF